MNEYMMDERRCCFHPREMVVGVCALCLNERLLVVASKQEITNTNHSFTPRLRVLPKIFALANLLHRSDNNKLSKSEVYDSTSSAPSPEDSFISIKFGENGVASWDKGKLSQISHEMSSDEVSSDKTMTIKSVIEHAKPRATTLRWRRRIGHLLQLIKWKRATKGSVCHMGTKLEGSKVKYGWIRILTKRRTKE